MLDFKRRFYRCPWANYESAKPGTFRLIPRETHVTELRKDYEQMKAMIYRNVPEFDQIMDTLKVLEGEVNQLDAASH